MLSVHERCGQVEDALSLLEGKEGFVLVRLVVTVQEPSSRSGSRLRRSIVEVEAKRVADCRRDAAAEP